MYYDVLCVRVIVVPNRRYSLLHVIRFVYVHRIGACNMAYKCVQINHARMNERAWAKLIHVQCRPTAQQSECKKVAKLS